MNCGHEGTTGAVSPTVLIVGAGAIGGFYGARLKEAGAQVSVVCRSDLEAVKSKGIHILSEGRDYHFFPHRVVRYAEEYGSHPDFVLVATKVIAGAEVPELIRGVVGPRTTILLIQNGIAIEQPVQQAFPEAEILSGLAFIAVSRVSPGVIRHIDYGRLTLGRYPSGVSSRAEQLRSLLESVGVPCVVTEDVVTARWQKLVWNAPFNPISVLAGGVDTQTILESNESARLVREVMVEVCRIATAANHPLPPEVIDQNIEGTRVMKPYKTSMLLDFENGRPMEVEAILGNAVRIARSLSVPVPHMETLYGLLQLLDAKR